MFGMSHETFLLLDAVVTVIGLIVLITKFKLHPFLALIIAAALGAGLVIFFLTRNAAPPGPSAPPLRCWPPLDRKSVV